jgi:hypothetical protein
MTISKFACLLFSNVIAISAFAQNELPKKNENGAVSLYSAAGWTFGLPAIRAAVTIPGVGSAISPLKKTLISPGFGVGVRAWKFLVPFADFSTVDTGKAYAQVGPVRSDAQADTFTFNGGLRLIGSTSRIRPYAQFGGGLIHQDLKGTFTFAGQNTPANAAGSIGSAMYGGGLQVFAGRKWGTDIGFDGFHFNRPMSGGGQNYSRVHIAVFYQTKSAVE